MSLSNLQYLGNDLSFHSANFRGGLNVVNGTRAITSRLLTLLLTRKGEDPIHPTLGIAPELFEPLSYDEPHYLVYAIREEIQAWNKAAKIGLSSLQVEINSQNVYTNEIYVFVSFTPMGRTTGEIDVLTFGYWAWKGAIYDEDLETFIRGISFNGKPFFGLS